MDEKEREALEEMGEANANIKHMLLMFTDAIAEKGAEEAEFKKEKKALEAEKQALKTELETERKEKIARQDKAEAQRITDAKKGLPEESLLNGNISFAFFFDYLTLDFNHDVRDMDLVDVVVTVVVQQPTSLNTPRRLDKAKGCRGRKNMTLI